MSRVDIPQHERSDFTLIVDEFQSFATASFASILSEARKFNLSLIVAHQYVKQLDEAVADAVFGNVGTLITFRVGADDAELLEKEFMPDFTAQDLVNLGFRNIYLKLMIDGVTSHSFSATTMDTIAKPEVSHRDEVIEYSRSMYAHPRAEVEKMIANWRAPMPKSERPHRDAGSSRYPEGKFPSQQVSTGALRRNENQRPVTSSPKPGSLKDLVKGSHSTGSGQAVDFRGRPVQEKTKDKPIATGTSVSFVSNADLKALIAKVLGKK